MPSKASEAVSDARSPSLPWISCVREAVGVGGDEEAGDPLVLLLGVGLGEHQRDARRRCPSEIHIFWPLILQPPSIFSARVRIEEGSEPASGSVRPKQPKISPEVRPGSQRCFCSSVPQRSIDPQTSEVCTETTVRIAESPRPTSSTIRP